MKAGLASLGLVAVVNAAAVWEACSSTAICDAGLTCVLWSQAYSQCTPFNAAGVPPPTTITATVTATATVVTTATVTVSAAPASCTSTSTPAEDTTPIFTDGALLGGWQDWSWNSVINYAATDLKEGTSSMLINSTAYGALSLKGPALLNTFSGLTFDIAADPTTLQLYFQSSADDTVMSSDIALTTLGSISPDAFTTVTVSFSDFGSAAYDRINFQALSDGAVYHLDNIALINTPPPAIVVTDVYTDAALASGWEDWSWNDVVDYASTTLKEGTSSIFVNLTGYGALSLKAAVQLNTFSALQFDVATDPSTVQVYFQSSADQTQSSANIPLSSLSSSITPTAFTTVTIPFTDFINFSYDRINFQASQGDATLYLDNIELLLDPSNPTPTSPPSTPSTPIPVTCPTEGRTKFLHFGVSESGAEFGSGAVPGVLGKDYTWPVTSSVDSLMALGMNTFRITFLMERLAPPTTGLTGPFDPTYLTGLTTIANYVTSKGGFALLDPHNYMRYNGSIITSTSDFATFWTNLSTVFKNNSNIVFDLQNEPHDMPAADVFALSQAAINAIRANGATTQLILVEGTSWTGAWTWTTTSGNGDVFAAISDPFNNTAIEMHQYLDSDGSGTNPVCVSDTIGSERIAAATQWLQANGLKGFLGELGAGSNDDCIRAIQGMLCDMQMAGGVWIGALWWAAGPWWGSYFMSMEPPSGISLERIMPEALLPFL